MTNIKEAGFIETIKDFPNRIITLVWKMLSIKFIGFLMAVWMIVTNKVEGWHAVALFCITFFFLVLGREALKWLEVIKGLK
jgi:hypothetical protein